MLFRVPKILWEFNGKICSECISYNLEFQNFPGEDPLTPLSGSPPRASAALGSCLRHSTLPLLYNLRLLLQFFLRTLKWSLPTHFLNFFYFWPGNSGRGLMRNMCLLGEVLPNFFFLRTNLKIVNNKAHHIVHHVRHHSIFNGSIFLYRMYRAFDTSLLKHQSFLNSSDRWTKGANFRQVRQKPHTWWPYCPPNNLLFCM